MYIPQIFKAHFLAIILAILIGLISVAPQVIFSFSPSYQGIQMFGTDAEEYYIARINEVYDGHPGLGNVFLPDKAKPYIVPPLGEIIVAGIGKILFLDAVHITVFLKFLLPAALCLLIYVLVASVFSSKSIGLISASLILLGDNLLSSSADIFGLFKLTTTSVDFLSYTRPINPSLSSFFLFGALLFLWRVLDERRERWKQDSILLGALSGLAVYIYMYTWSFLVVVLSFAALYSLWKRNGRFRGFLWAFAVHALITIPYWVNMLSARMYPEYQDTVVRLGLAAGRMPVWGIWLLLSSALIFCIPKRFFGARWFFGILLLSSWVVTNQHVLTGKMLQIGHYHWYIVKPLASILLAAVFVFLAERIFKKRALAACVAAVSVLVLLYNGALIQFFSYRAHYAEAVEKQRYAPLIAYLREEYKTPQVIWSDADISAILPMYTAHDAPNRTSVFAFLNSTEYLVHRLFFDYQLRGITPKTFAGTLGREGGIASGRVFGHMHDGSSPIIPFEISARWEKQYQEFSLVPPKRSFQYFDITLFVQDLQNEGGTKIIPMIEKIAEVENKFIVYKVN